MMKKNFKTHWQLAWLLVFVILCPGWAQEVKAYRNVTMAVALKTDSLPIYPFPISLNESASQIDEVFQQCYSIVSLKQTKP